MVLYRGWYEECKNGEGKNERITELAEPEWG